MIGKEFVEEYSVGTNRIIELEFRDLNWGLSPKIDLKSHTTFDLTDRTTTKKSMQYSSLGICWK